MNERLNFIKLLLEYESISVDDILVSMNSTRKKLWYEIEQINEILRSLSLNEISVEENVINIDESLKKNESKIIKAYYDDYQYIPREFRQDFMILYLLTEEEEISVSHFISFLQVSRNTVLNEIKDLRSSLCEMDTTLEYTRESGYFLKGNASNIRKIVEKSIHNVTSVEENKKYIKNFFSTLSLEYNVDDIVYRINQLCIKYNVEFITERYEEFVYLFTLKLNGSFEPLILNQKTINHLNSNYLKQFAEELCNYFGVYDENEIIYTLIWLLSALQGSQKMSLDHSLYEITLEIIARMNALTLGSINKSDTTNLTHTLYEHLVPSYYRLLYDIQLNNPFTEKIKNEYSNLFSLVDKSLEPLSLLVGKKIPESEIAYFTIHFGGYIRSIEETEKLKAVTVCPQGISSSLLLKSQLESLFPEIEIVGVLNSKELLKDVDQDFDMIFSTIPLLSEKPVFVMKPIMNWMERDILTKNVLEKFNVTTSPHRVKVSEIMSLIEKYAVIEDKEMLSQEIGNLLFKKKTNKEENDLKTLMDRSLMQISDEELSWEEAIALASKPLLDQGFIEEQYITAMIDKVNEIGPYIVLAPMVAIPHARPEDGANKLAIGILKTTERVRFDFNESDKDVKLIFVLSAVDNSSHLYALQQLSHLLEDQENIDKIISMENLDEILAFILENSEEVEE